MTIYQWCMYKIWKKLEKWYEENEKLYEVYISGPYRTCTKDELGCNLRLSKLEIKEREKEGYKCTIL